MKFRKKKTRNFPHHPIFSIAAAIDVIFMTASLFGALFFRAFIAKIALLSPPPKKKREKILNAFT